MPRLADRRLLFRLAISGGLVGLLVWRVNIGEALQAFTEANYLFVIPALPVYTVSKLVDAQRWRLMLKPIGEASVGGLFGSILIANMANNAAPVRVGDLLRIQIPAQRYGLPRAGLTATVFVTETLVDGIAFVALGLLGLALLPEFPSAFTNLLWALFGAVMGGVVIAAIGAQLRLEVGWQETGWLRWVPARARQALGKILPQFLEGLGTLRDPRLAFNVMALSFAAWLLETVMFWLFGQAFGLGLSFSSYLVIMIAANMIVAMPVAPSNIGPYELATAEVVAALGVARPLAGGYAIGTHLLNIAWVGVSGLIAMWMLRVGLEDLFYLRRSAPEPAPGSDGPS
jgi:uncharacterized protein (TIRG00374 family)